MDQVVGVHPGDEVATAAAESELQRRDEAAAFAPHHDEAGIGLRRGSEDPRGLVRRGIVDADDLEGRRASLREEALQRTGEGRGDVRDVQLQIGWLHRHHGTAPAREKALAEKEAALRRALALWSLRSAPRVLRALPHARNTGKLSGGRMRKRLRRRIADVSHALEEARDLKPAAAHALRIAAKKLRYEAELLKDAFDLDALIEELSRLQDAFGDLHDADARIAVTRRDRRLSGMAKKERERLGKSAVSVLRRWQRARLAFEARKRS